ncbi:MAG: glycosyltransferase family 2 protein [Planctomycetota bacterium]|jgi:glycosyltransferase involved in cell wall biosynthesis
MKISVVIPAYNAEKHIARAIESVLAQTRPADEVIVIDDGSSDGTGDVVRSFGDKVIFIQQENAGASVARNAGIEAATSDWIAFLDADDEWLPEKLRIQSQHLSRNPDLRWTTANYYRCHCEQDHQYVPDMSESQIHICQNYAVGEIFEDYLRTYPKGVKGHTDTMLIHRDLLKEAGLFLPAQKRMNDVDLWFRIAFIEPRIGFIFEPLAVYHLGITNSIMKVNTDWQLMDTFLNRQLELARNAHRVDAFRPCAAVGLSFWMRILMDKGQGSGIRILIHHHGDLLVPSFRLSCYVGSFCPSLWRAKERIKKRVRSALGRL